MARSWDEMKESMTPDQRAHIETRAEQLVAIITLSDLIRERNLTQEAIADRLEVAQGNVSRTLRRNDLRVSTLRSVVEAMAGELQLVAQFPDRTYAIAAEE
jgi:predicted XRE-type DNA-binding protein